MENMDNFNLQEIIKIDVNITDLETIENSTSKVVMISFKGKASGEFFTGTILPGAIDTQQKISNSEMSISARYILKGKDFMNDNCRIFIENNGIAKIGDSVFYARPKIITDSVSLKWLEAAQLESQIIPNENRVEVLIYAY